MRIIACDFDGSIHKGSYPYIGQPNQDLIDYLIESRRNGDKVILWTCRTDVFLVEAVNWCKGIGLEFDAVNRNLPESIARYGHDGRKIFADIYIDDRAAYPSDFKLSRRGRHHHR